MTKKIMIIEDEEDLCTTMAYVLKKEGYKVTTECSGEGGLARIQQGENPDLFVLDIMLPGMSGIGVCRWLREEKRTRNTPILFLSARGEEIDRIVGFESGADDYLVKPFNTREFILRVQAVLQRSIKKQEAQGMLFAEGCKLKMDHEKHQVWVAEREVILTAIEFKLLRAFLSTQGKVLSRDALINRAWHYQVYVQSRSVDAHVKRLRQKLGIAGQCIETLRGVGYRFRDLP